MYLQVLKPTPSFFVYRDFVKKFYSIGLLPGIALLQPISLPFLVGVIETILT